MNHSWILGIVGFIGFEGLRIYKAVLRKRAAVPQNRYGIYAFSITLLLVFSGFAAEIMAGGNKLTALFVGFSVPTGMKALFDDQMPRNGTGPTAEAVKVEDTKIINLSPMQGIWIWVKTYFS